LKELRNYILKNFGKDNWQTCLNKIKASVDTIQSFPERGNIPEELVSVSLSQYRQVVSGMNRIIYEVRGDTAYIHIVCDTRKEMKALLTKRLLRINQGYA
jgi:plasmid stabilization system protein ParE